jgi:sulfur-oxidizing protein SoxA
VRFPDWIAASALAVTLAMPGGADASAEQVRAAITGRLREMHPSLGPAELATGAAAFDAARRAEAQQNVPAPGAAAVIESGRQIWIRKFAKGRSLAGCFPNGGRRIAAAYPQFDQRLKRVVTLETAINQCLKAHGQPLLDSGDAQTMGAVLAYVRSLADGQKTSVRVATPQAEEHFEEGRRLFFTRMGQQNYACASCHLQNAGKYFGNAALPATVGLGAHWPYVRAGRAASMQASIRECLDRMGAAPYAPGAGEYATLEYFLAFLSNGIAVKPNAWRPQ